jgi:hypothetical protein
LRRYSSAVARTDVLRRERISLSTKTVAAFNDVISQLKRSRGEVAALYEKGVVSVEQPAERPGKPGAVEEARKAAPGDPPDGRDATKGDGREAPKGSVNELLAGSACTGSEFRKAVTAGDRDTLDGLRGRIVAWRAMLTEAAKELEDRTVVGVTSQGASLPAEFPADTAVGGLLPGASLVIVGELREAKGAWTIHVMAWGRKRMLDAGEPMVRCRWPQPIE